MKSGTIRRGGYATLLAGSLALAALSFPGSVKAGPVPAYGVSNIGHYGGEPSIASDGTGRIYVDSPSLGLQVFDSSNHGATFAPMGTDPDATSGDNCLATDQANAVWECNLNGSQSVGPLQADVWKTTDLGVHWLYGNNNIDTTPAGNICGTSCNPFMVDRQWLDATTQTGMTSGQTGSFGAISYHDFSAQSHIYINLSDNGGATWSVPEDIVANFNPTTSAAAAIADTACSTVPAGTRIAKGGAHPGRIYVAWLAADPSSLLTGCNFTQAQAFHNLIVAYADPPFDMGTMATPPTTKWTAVVAADIGPFHDASTPFVSFTTDDQGNPYFGYAANANSNPATCSVPFGSSQVRAASLANTSCEYDMYVVWSHDDGVTWGSPIKVNSDTGTHFWPAIGAGDPGHVWLAWLRTPAIIPTDPNGKEHPGSCVPTGACNFTGLWDEWVGQSSNLLNGNTMNTNPTWVRTQIPNGGPMHEGDICNLGIACIPGVSNRNLLDFQSITIDPSGCAHIAYPDDKTNNKVMVASETTGCMPLTVGPGSNVPESPTAVLLVPFAVGVAALTGWVARRRRRAAIIG